MTRSPRILATALMLGLLVAAAAIAAPLNVDALANRSKISYPPIPPKVLAFYYPWYGTSYGSGGMRHWTGVDKQAKTIANSAHYPALGPYDSQNPEVVEQHVRWAKQAGIDALIVSWWGHGDYTDRAMDLILDTAQEYGLEVTAYYEGVPKPRTSESAAKDILRLLQRYADHPAWLRVQGKPVVFIYGRAMNQLGLTGWLNAIARVNREYKGTAAFIGDVFSPSAARIFDGLHAYNTAGHLAGKTPKQVRQWADHAYASWVRMAEQADRISTITVIPGYDDTKNRDPGTVVKRYGGKLYRIQWQEAIEADPDWILITSFNEWHEGSEIEPSHEYEKKYLRITAKYAHRFKTQPPQPQQQNVREQQVSRLSAGQIQKLQQKLEQVEIAVLPGASSRALWWLVTEVGARPTMLSTQDLVSGELSVEQYPILLYAGDEHYLRGLSNSEGTDSPVDQAIRHYLDQGGLLMVLPSSAMPFYYAQGTGEVVHNAPKFGLPLVVGGSGPVSGWEQPPEGASLTFVKAEGRLPNLPATFAFPSHGDLRWRPLVAGRLPDSAKHVALVKLVDERGRYRGDAVTYVKYREGALEGGKVLYAWFTLLNQPYGQALLYDLFTFALNHTQGSEVPGF